MENLHLKYNTVYNNIVFLFNKNEQIIYLLIYDKMDRDFFTKIPV